MGVLDDILDWERKFEDGTMDKYVEREWWLKDTYQKTLLTAFVVDEDNDLHINDLGKYCKPPIRSKYIDLSDCSEGEYNLFCKHLSQFQYDGLLIDNIDKIPNNKDREYWEAFVRSALKREDEYPLPLREDEDPIPPFGDNINFSKMHIAVRCREYPEYLTGKSLQCFIIEPNNRFHSLLLDKDK